MTRAARRRGSVGRLPHAARASCRRCREASVDDRAAASCCSIVGESGSGKTVLAHTLLRLLPRNVDVSGSVRLGDEDLLGLKHRRAAPRARAADGAHPAEPRLVAEPGAQARRPAAGRGAGPRADRGRGTAAPDDAARRARAGPRLRQRALRPPAVRRHAAADRQRDGARRRARHRHRRRADLRPGLRPRRDDGRSAARDLRSRRVAAGHHPRPAPRAAPRRPARAAVREPDRRARPDGGVLRRRRRTRTAASCCGRCPNARAGRSPACRPSSRRCPSTARSPTAAPSASIAAATAVPDLYPTTDGVLARCFAHAER